MQMCDTLGSLPSIFVLKCNSGHLAMCCCLQFSHPQDNWVAIDGVTRCCRPCTRSRRMYIPCLDPLVAFVSHRKNGCFYQSSSPLPFSALGIGVQRNRCPDRALSVISVIDDVFRSDPNHKIYKLYNVTLCPQLVNVRGLRSTFRCTPLARFGLKSIQAWLPLASCVESLSTSLAVRFRIRFFH